MRAVVLRSLLVIATGAVILAGVLYVASTVDARPPQVLRVDLTQPLANDSSTALITTSLEITFSEPVEHDAAAAAISLDPPVDGSVSWSGSTMIFTPHDPLELETEYTLAIGAGIRDLAGNEMTEQPPPYNFETAGRPGVAETSPEDGASDVTLDEPIVVSFSTLMDTASVEAGLRLRPTFAHDLRWSGQLLEIVPTEALRANQDYELTVGPPAADVAGVAIGEPVTIRFRTVAPGLRATATLPADGIDGIAMTTPIAVVFDRPIDADSVSGDLLEISPEVAGSIDLIPLPDKPDDLRVLRFTPSGPLPANTTFELELSPGLTNVSGGGLAEPVRWTFTTGAPLATLSNQLTFISDRAGIANVWAMNADGTGQHQVTAELTPVLDYAVAPNGSSLVVADGRQLVFLRADGSERQVITDDGHLEFDPAYAPNGARIAFARADAASGWGLGLWEWELGAGAATRIDLPPDLRGRPSSGPDEEEDHASMPLRAPRYAPDGQALAFVDAGGWLGIVELPAERLTRSAFTASGAPIWLPDGTGVFVTGMTTDDSSEPPRFDPPVEPMSAARDHESHLLYRSGTRPQATAFGEGSRVVAVAADGRIGYLEHDGTLRIAMSPDRVGRVPPAMRGVRIGDAAFAPDEAAMVIVVVDADADRPDGRIERLEVESGERAHLVREGWRPRWQP